MRVVKLKNKDLVSFLKGLKDFGTLWGPVKKGKQFVYKDSDPEEFDLSALRTIIPPKKFLLPPEIVMSVYKNGEWSYNYEDEKNIIFGLHPCDISGLNIYHKFFTRTYEDPYYIKRKNSTVIIGLSCIPDDKCFCNQTKTSEVEEGFDLFLTILSDFILLWIGSPKGDELINNLSGFFDENISEEDINLYIDWRKKREKSFKLDIDLSGMPEIMKLSEKNKIWEELADACFSCGRCSITCPTCTCFNIYDEVDIREGVIKKVRTWYSCLSREYSLVAGGYNFRSNRKDRLRLWYTHKLEGFMSEYGYPACVGCGRCIETCPVDINLYTVSKSLQNEDVEAFWKKNITNAEVK